MQTLNKCPIELLKKNKVSTLKDKYNTYFFQYEKSNVIYVVGICLESGLRVTIPIASIHEVWVNQLDESIKVWSK